MQVERITKAPRFTRREVSEALGVTVRTVSHWTQKGILTVTTWKSPGGRVYRHYDVAEVARLRESMGVENQ